MLEWRADLAFLDDILRRTVVAIKESHEQIEIISNEARAEAESIARELEQVNRQMQATIVQVETARVQEQLSRQELVRVSRDFKRYREEDILRAYERARDVQVQLILLKEKEKALWEKRSEIEQRFRGVKRLLERAEALSAKVGVAMDYLTGNVKQMSEVLESVQEKREIAVRVIRAQEEERRRVARDLHDGLAQQLAGAILELEVAQRVLEQDADRAREELKNVEQIIRTGLREARDVIFNLRPLALDSLGLKAAIENLAAQIRERTGLDVNVSLLGNETPLDSTVLSCVYRIAQEALNNVVKHAAATRVMVRIEFSPSYLFVQVVDNGRGFVVDAKGTAVGDGEEHLGLIGMRERADLIGGKLQVKSEPGCGTTIKFCLPLTVPEAAHQGLGGGKGQ
ncbi:MAG: sensor histidine kinase [Firmicutes bacterium]|nr:sensor histidine kinase [Bacillota bacterium]